ncbi:MAG: sigma-70 family RNA polymerase sigma factor [Flavobacteriales bacterium]|nr:sigma-70 family RNA polymerase sigma factor [Flavobacteriales bacterium]
MKHLRDTDLAKDVVQGKLCTAVAEGGKVRWLKSEKLPHLQRTTSWWMGCGIARSTRMEAKHTNMQWSGQSQPDLKEVLNAALATLPEVQRSVVLLRDLEGYSYEEIAELTQLNTTQVKVYIYRGRTALKDYIGSLENVL